MGAQFLSVFRINRNEDAIKYYKPLPVNRIMIAFCRWNKYSPLAHIHTKSKKILHPHAVVLRIECMLHRSAQNS